MEGEAHQEGAGSRRRWAAAVAVSALLVCAIAGARVERDAQRELEAASGLGADHHAAAVTLGWGAASVAPWSGGAADAVERLESASGADAQAALASASANGRGLWRPWEAKVDRARVERGDARFGSPSVWARLLAALGLLGWLGGAGVWVVVGWDARGRGARRGWWPAAASLLGFVVWLAANAWA